MRHSRNITAGQKRMRVTASRMSHGYKEKRILVGSEDVSSCTLYLSFFFFLILSLTMPDLLMKKQ
jgi:hypothetical protein